MNQDLAIRGATLSLETGHYRTTLAKDKVTKFINKLLDLEDDDMSNADKYKAIDEILKEVTEDKFEAYTDKVEITGLHGGMDRIKEGKRGSKPNEFISVLLKVLERQQF